jgi:serine/threonine-protein kinase
MKKKKKTLDWLLGLVVTLFFLFITSTGMFDFTDDVEMKIFDFGARIAASGEKNGEIELVVINDDDFSELGPFPWPRHILAQAARNLARAGAKVIAINILFDQPEESEGLKAVRRLKEDYELLGLIQQGAGLVFYNELSGALADLDNDAKFYKALENAGNVVLPVYFHAGGADSAKQPHDFIAKHAFHRTKDIDQRGAKSDIIRLSGSKSILPSFGEAAAGIGHINFFPDHDGYVRNVVHVLEYQRDIYFPSFPIAIVKLFKGIKDEDMTVVFGEGINLRVSPSSVVKVPVIDPQMRTMVNWSKGPDVAFRQTPFIKVFNNQAPAGMFKDKIVIVGLTETRLGKRFPTPISGNLPGNEIVANSVANILNQRFISAPPWIPVVELAALVFFGLFITFVLPRMKAGMGAVITMGLLLSYGLSGTSILWFSNTWFRVASPSLLLILGYALVITRRLVFSEKTEEREEQRNDTGIMGVSEGIPDVKYDKATNGFERSEEGHPGDVSAVWEDTATKQTLGRYEVIGEIGRGAMGVVYEGQDPKIGRKVAIKTVRLSEFDEDIVDEIRDRFYREAESAGLLSHPNIVTIYDCGEESDLAYIAMEYLEGEALDPHTKADHLLPLRETLHIVAGQHYEDQ